VPGADARRAEALIERALASNKVRGTWQYPFLLVARGLAEYRNGRYEAALETLEHLPANVLEPMPDLIVAMSRARLGQTAAARRALARAVVAYDWSPVAADDATRWIRHVLVRNAPRNPKDSDPWVLHLLRREAETLVLPDLPAFLAGAYQPRDADERLAMTGACQSLERNAAHAQLWADAYASEQSLASASRRYAVCAAVLAGCGRGNDAAGLGEAERRRLRGQAHQWIRAELSDALEEGRKLGVADNVTPQFHAGVIKAWLSSPDLAGVRDASALARLPAEEAREWTALWHEAASVLGPPRPAVWTPVPPPPLPIDDPPSATQNSDRRDLSRKK
jgi:serine/threonine-protein kinase